MCTSLTYENLAHQHLLARTMDFPTTTPWRPIFLPRRFEWHTGLATTMVARYAYLGGGRLPVNWPEPLMADGVNETGLTCAELYLPHAARYADQPAPKKINLTPQDFINWVLAQHRNLAEVVADLPHVQLVAQSWADDDFVYPFHWLLSDNTGQTLVIEPTGEPLKAQVNPSGILTNTPVLTTHLQNLAKLLDQPSSKFTTNTITAAQNWHAQKRPLPTGDVPTARFNRMALLRWGSPTVSAVTTNAIIMNWLAQVSLPYDAHRRHQLSHNYTHYRAVINATTQEYLFWSRTAEQPRHLRLTPAMAETWTVPFIFPIN
ncbi:linear amide C-N hydrolase [Lactiplantibacillus fabifermentans]|nr:linear amide C-N hydrolase [Lactiplantibacillus fabifermentans]ETY73665.1 penicillin V acylase [Lactiplantibacillus fabifermentans T30PCM01]